MSWGTVAYARYSPVLGGRVQNWVTGFDNRIPLMRFMPNDSFKTGASQPQLTPLHQHPHPFPLFFFFFVSPSAWGSLVVGFGVWVGGTYISQKLMKMLLRYKGYLYDGPKSVSWQSRVWSLSILLFRGFSPAHTHSYDNVLPSLPGK